MYINYIRVQGYVCRSLWNFVVDSWTTLNRFFNERGSCRRDVLLLRKSFVPRGSSCTSCNWSTDCGSCCWGLRPNDLQLPRGIRKQSISLWTVRSSQLRSRANLLLGRRDCCRRVFRSRSSWSIQGGSAFQLRLSNRPWLSWCICCMMERWTVRNSIRSRADPFPRRIRCPEEVDDIGRSRKWNVRGTRFVQEQWWMVPWRRSCSCRKVARELPGHQPG